MSGGLTWNSQHGTQGATRGVETCMANTPGIPKSLRDGWHELDEQCEGDGGGTDSLLVRHLQTTLPLTASVRVRACVRIVFLSVSVSENLGN